MKMNNFYMVLAAAALGLSSNAKALTFTDGDFTGGVDFGGDITVPVATNHWQWASGDAIALDHNVTALTNGYKTMTIPAASNLPLLVGQTTAATVGNAGSAGLNPQIAFTDALGAAVTPVWDSTGNTGKGNISLPVTAADGTTVLGHMNMIVKAGGVKASQHADGSTYLESVHTTNTAVKLYGPVALPSVESGSLANGSSATAWNAVLGAYPASNMLSQLTTASGVPSAAFGLDGGTGSSPFGSPDTYFAGTYGLGIAQGDNIVVDFTNPVTVTTFWKSALKATVTYL